ncbi:Sensor protein gacS [Hordeum vulgare]|nr:Sensor protein gacS [Hordeum vulgare]
MPLVACRARPRVRRGAGDSVPLSPTPTGSPTGGSASLTVLLHAAAVWQTHVAGKFRFDLTVLKTLYCSCLFEMPVMNGYEATRRIREEESRDGIRIPIIALTANSTEKGLKDAMEAGMDLHLAKPIPKPRIAQIVLDLCNQVQN